MQNNKNLTLLTMALAAILVLFGINLISHLGNNAATPAGETPVVGNNLLALKSGDVKGMSIERDGKVYTLNQKQQTAALDFINRFRPVDKQDYPQRDRFVFSKLTVMRFNQPDVVLIPVAFKDKDLVFDIPSLNSGSYLLDLSGGEFYSLIQNSTRE